MRIILNIRDTKADRKRAISIETSYQFNGGDSIRVCNCGAEIYGILKEGLTNTIEGAVLTHRGEVK